MRYYFLIGFLPELKRDDGKIKFGLPEFLGEAYHIQPLDWQEIELVQLFRDICVIERLLFGKSVFIEHSLYGVEFWREQIQSQKEGPEFILDFLKEVQGAEFSPGWADRLYGVYYDHVLKKTKNRLLRGHIRFEQNLRNLMAALRARKKGLNVADVLVGESDFVDALVRSNADDFGLGGEFPWVEEMMTTEYPLQHQELMEQLLWDYLDENMGSDPFHFNAVLSYLIKLQMLDKKLALSEEEGMAIVRRLEGR